MHVALICKDKPDHLQVRMDNRPAHVEFLNGLNAQGKLGFAGPLVENGNPMGSLVVLQVESIDKAIALARQDPYAKAGLFAGVEIRQWNWVFNAPGAS
jgi:uncharacterized protein